MITRDQLLEDLHQGHYGRYVDDFYVVSCDKAWLETLIPQISEFLSIHLGLEVHEGKTEIKDVVKGVEFLGAFLLPYRIYISRNTLTRMDAKLSALELENDAEHVRKALNSYCGVLSHWQNHHVRRVMLLRRHRFL